MSNSHRIVSISSLGHFRQSTETSLSNFPSVDGGGRAHANGGGRAHANGHGS